MTCIGISFYVIARSQRTANEVSVHHCVALVRRLKSLVLVAYCVGVLAFFISLIVLCWMYIGNPNWQKLEGPPGVSGTRWATGFSSNPNESFCNPSAGGSASGLTGNPACDSCAQRDSNPQSPDRARAACGPGDYEFASRCRYIANGWDTPVVQPARVEPAISWCRARSLVIRRLTLRISLQVQADNQEMLVTCFNPYNQTQQERQRTIGHNVATSLTVAFCCVALGGFGAFLYVRHQFERLERIVVVEKKAPEILHSTELLERVTPDGGARAENFNNRQ
jgi:hypothetical protein